MNTFYSKFIFTFLLFCSSYSLFAHVELDNPTGGETFISGTTVTIQWHITISHVTLNWDLLYSPDGGSTWEFIHEDIPSGALSYQWLVPNGISSHARISIIQDNQGMDYQDESNDFIVQSSATSVPTIPDFKGNIFPNPVSNILTIDLTAQPFVPTQLTLLDVTGRQVWQRPMESSVIEVPVQSYLAGLYFLLIETAQGMQTRKIIIQKS